MGTHRLKSIAEPTASPTVPLATYVPTWAGFVYLAIVLDVFSRRVVGWAMANHLRTELVLAALNDAGRGLSGTRSSSQTARHRQSNSVQNRR